MNKPVRMAAVSFDHGHQYSYLRAMLRLPEIELVAISEPDCDERAVAQRLLAESGGDSVRVHASHADVFQADDIDAVSICAANADHHDLTLAAAEAGKHVLCEKPLAVSLDQATAMVRGCADHGVTLATAYPVRHAPQVWEAKRRLDSGDLGSIRAMSLTNVLRAQPIGWFIDPSRSGGGAIRDHIVHATDLMRWFIGGEVRQIYCEAGTLARDIPVDDTGALIEVFDSGVVGTCDPSWNRPPTWRKWGDVSGRIVCEGGVIELLLGCQAELHDGRGDLGGVEPVVDEAVEEGHVLSRSEEVERAGRLNGGESGRHEIGLEFKPHFRVAAVAGQEPGEGLPGLGRVLISGMQERGGNDRLAAGDEPAGL